MRWRAVHAWLAWMIFTGCHASAQMPLFADTRPPQTPAQRSAGKREKQGNPSSARRPHGAQGSSGPVDPVVGPAPTPAPGALPFPAFVQKYEAAYVKYLEKDYAGAKALLDEADALQPGQKSAADLRDLIFKGDYEGAYVSFRKGDYAAALDQLGQGDAVKPNNPDALNLRGLVLSRQRDYEHAEAAFKKASQLDPSFYAAKFNYAELPFNYRNYTVARARFEDLFSQTDPARQPVEAEITQFKVFLTLLLEGKVDQARQFMDHFNFTGATPARYFCQASLDFYGGNMEKAQGWIDSAGKEFKPQLVSIFKESFYRIGWMSDVNGQPALASGGPPPAVPPGPPVVQFSDKPTASRELSASASFTTPKTKVSDGAAVSGTNPSVSLNRPGLPDAKKPAVTPGPTRGPVTAGPGESPSQDERPLQILLAGLIVIPSCANLILILRAAARRRGRASARPAAPGSLGSSMDLEPAVARATRYAAPSQPV